MAKQKFNVVNRQISHDIVAVAKQGELTLDEVVLLWQHDTQVSGV